MGDLTESKSLWATWLEKVAMGNLAARAAWLGRSRYGRLGWKKLLWAASLGQCEWAEAKAEVARAERLIGW